MHEEQDGLFAAVDALLEEAAAQDALPHPDERKRLREAAGLSQEQIAKALSVRRETVTSWETGRTAPRPPKRAAYIRLLDGLAGLHPRTDAVIGVNGVNGVNAPDVAVTVDPAPEREPEGAASLAIINGVNAVNAPDGAAAEPEPEAAASLAIINGVNAVNAVDAAPVRRAPWSRPAALEGNGPLAVLDGAGRAHAAGGLVLDHPTTGLPALVSWALGPEADLRSPRLHRNGKDGDPLLVLTAEATEALGLPLVLEDRRGLRLPDDHPVLRQLAKAKWQLTRRGFGPWARIYRPATQGAGRQCVQLAVLPWGALDPRAWGEDTTALPAPELAELLTCYAARVLTPRGSTAVSGLELMTALRPPTRAARNPGTGVWESAPVAGSLVRPVDPAPPEAPDEHPVVAALYPRAHRRTPDQVLDEEAYDWIRDPELLTDAECARTHAVGIDVNMAFAAAANRLTVGLGPAVHTRAPRFDPKTPGCWLADLSGPNPDPRLPSPFTPHGKAPAGPAWYATPTLAYAQELGHEVRPTEAWLRPDNGPYLDAWYARLRDAYLATMADLGVHPDLDEAAYLAAMESHKEHDPARTAVLSAIKSTVKGGIGKLRERPQGAAYRPGEPWPALERPTWRPDIRAAVIATARVNMHRKMSRLAAAGEYPVAVLSDCAVYLSDGPGPLDFLPRTPEGKPLPGGFRLGVSPGMVKHEGTQPLLWAVRMLDERHNPARHIKGHDAAADGE